MFSIGNERVAPSRSHTTSANPLEASEALEKNSPEVDDQQAGYKDALKMIGHTIGLSLEYLQKIGDPELHHAEEAITAIDLSVRTQILQAAVRMNVLQVSRSLIQSNQLVRTQTRILMSQCQRTGVSNGRREVV